MNRTKIRAGLVALAVLATSGSIVGRVRAQNPQTFVVSDDKTNTVEQFNLAGGLYQETTLGSKNSLFVPRGLAFSGSTLYAASLGNGQIFQYVPSTASVNANTWQALSLATGTPAPLYANGIAFDGAGHLFVSSYLTTGSAGGNGQVIEYNVSGGALSLVKTFTTDAGSGVTIHGPTGIVVGPDGNVYVNSGKDGTVDMINASTGHITQFGTGLSVTDGPAGLYFGTSGGVTKLFDVTSNINGAGHSTVSSFGLTGGAATTITNLASQGVDPFFITPTGNLLVTSYDTGGILSVPSLGGTPTYLLGGPGASLGQFSYATAFPNGVGPFSVPEPSSLVLLALGAIGFAGYRRARSRRRATASA